MSDIYTTEGIVIKKVNIGEADCLYTIFTNKFGKIFAVAQGIRHTKSKLRYNLDIFSYSRLGIVSGRQNWRIINAIEKETWNKRTFSPYKLRLFYRITCLVDRMIQGEEMNNQIWEKIKNAYLFLKNEDRLGQKQLKEFEISSMLDILDSLGYANKDLCKNNTEKIMAINTAIKESML